MTPEQAFLVLQTFEGGDKVTTNPNDAGGTTKWGFSQAAYPNVDIVNLTKETALAMFVTDYWNKGDCVKLKPELQYVHADSCFNMGIETANKILQRAANILDDGIFGSQTLVQSDNVSIEAYLLQREWDDDSIVVHRQSQIVFLGGWENRNRTILSLWRSGKL